MREKLGIDDGAAYEPLEAAGRLVPESPPITGTGMELDRAGAAETCGVGSCCCCGCGAGGVKDEPGIDTPPGTGTGLRESTGVTRAGAPGVVVVVVVVDAGAVDVGFAVGDSERGCTVSGGGGGLR